MVTKEPRTTSKEIKGELQGQGTPVSDRTIRRCLSQSGPYGASNRIMTQNRQLHWTILKWPSLSTDLNPIEHLWKELKHAVWRRHPSNLRQLEQFDHEEWAKNTR